MKVIITTIGFIFICQFKVLAQQDTSHLLRKYYHFVNLELGKGSENMAYSHMSYAVQNRRNYYLKVSFANISEPLVLFLGDDPRKEMGSSGFLIGKSFTLNNYHNFQLGAGSPILKISVRVNFYIIHAHPTSVF